jgi:sigma-B regulation protein RsbU (phosphoserine phosphatase)
VGENDPHVIAFTIDSAVDPTQVVYLLGTLRHVINLRLLQRHLVSDVEEARRIQMSLLPERAPQFVDFDIAGRSVPAARVGGDLFDFLELSPTNLGVAVVDSSGHGLPAALMARDAITGLRVVLDVQYRLSRAIEKVNRVVARSGLTSRFITLFYAEFESNGNLVYCNAGHPPALLLRGGQIKELVHGGIVLGPDPKASYERGFEQFSAGSVLLIYTDGITEAANARGVQFGLARLSRLLKQCQEASAQGIVDAIFDAVRRHAPGPAGDDQTVVVVRRPAPG